MKFKLTETQSEWLSVFLMFAFVVGLLFAFGGCEALVNAPETLTYEVTQ